MKSLFACLVSINRVYGKVILIAVLFVSMIPGTGRTQEQAGTGPVPVAQKAQAAEADKVHLIVTGFVSGSEKDIGADCRNDLLAVQGMFATAFNQKGWRDRLVVHPLYGDYWTAAKILEYGRTMKIGSNDVVVFYQAGHGVIRDASQPIGTHELQVGAKEFLRRSQVRDMLLARDCRGVVILTDCCSNVSVQRGAQRSVDNETAPAPRLNQQTVRNLFLRFRGFVDITAAEVGSGAVNLNQLGNFGEARGAFTTAFLRVASEKESHQDWHGFFGRLQQTTLTSSGGRNRACALQIGENAAPQARPGKFPHKGTAAPVRADGRVDQAGGKTLPIEEKGQR